MNTGLHTFRSITLGTLRALGGAFQISQQFSWVKEE